MDVRMCDFCPPILREVGSPLQHTIQKNNQDKVEGQMLLSLGLSFRLEDTKDNPQRWSSRAVLQAPSAYVVTRVLLELWRK